MRDGALKKENKNLKYMETPKEGYIFDFISGQQLKATPEEVEAVQVFAKILVEDYNYPKEYIQTRPQFHVKVRPSDVAKEYPVDIAVFSSTEHSDDTISIIVECKKKNRKDGRSQLENYLTLSKARIGVWFNGDERFYIYKSNNADGSITYKDIPNIPKFGETIDDIGALKRQDLIPTHNLKATFKAIRNYLAANAVGATRDEVIAQQLINVIFCKIFDEKWTAKDKVVKFRIGVNDTDADVRKRIDDLFKSVKAKYHEVFTEEDSITLDEASIAYIVGELQNYCLIDAERDVLSDAFETFIGHALKGGQGQFFTPRNVVHMLVEILDPKTTEMIIDPACGSGGFIIESLRYIWNKVNEQGESLGWSHDAIREEEIDRANTCIRGIDKDYFLSKIAKSYMAIMGDGKGGIFCEDSLERPENWHDKTQQKIHLGEFDVVLTNPPFGAKIPVSGEDKLSQFELAHKWKEDKDGEWVKGKLADKEAPQILFIERCYQLLKFGGRMGIVLPDGVYGNESLGYIRKWLLNKGQIIGIIDIPFETFLPNTSTKTSILLFKKLHAEDIPSDYPVFMCTAESCGHDRRGNEIESDDIPLISGAFKEWLKHNDVSF